mgnify:FL=1
MGITYKKPVPTPEQIREEYKVPQHVKELKAKRDQEIKDVIAGKDDRFLVIIGPCSADREDSVLDYVTRLAKVNEKVSDRLIIIPRVYTNKPRTTGAGYKGMLHQPDPNGKPDMLRGVVAIRKLHMDVLKETGFSGADEMLYPDNHRYLSDLLSYVAVGARSVENQQHRLTASGIDSPVGMKNPTSGDISVMINAINAAQHGHTFIYRGWEVESKGNPLCHAILRGYVDDRGVSHPNYHYEDLVALNEAYKKSGLQNPAVIVDCNHSNSGKQYLEQIRIAKEVLHSTRYNPELRKLVKGLMIESYLLDGNQPVDGKEYGKSITDPCLGFEKTKELVLELAKMRKGA